MEKMMMVAVPENEFWKQMETIVRNTVLAALEEHSKNADAKKLLTTNETMSMLHISRPTITNLVKKKILKRTNIEGQKRNYYSMADIQAILHTRKR